MSEVEAGLARCGQMGRRDGLVAGGRAGRGLGRVLMLAWMNREALELTAATGRGGVLVAFARATVAQGRGVRARADGCATSGSIATGMLCC